MKHLTFFFVLSTCFLFGITAQQTLSRVISKPSAVVLSNVEEDRENMIRGACANPVNMILDFSMIDLRDDDLTSIFQGLVKRNLVEAQQYGLTFLNLTSEYITETGIVNFLILCQKGENKEGSKIYPDVRNTIVKTGFHLSQDALDLLENEAPSVLMGGLTLVG